jgi:uncharacterized protein (TIGR02588 family)
MTPSEKPHSPRPDEPPSTTPSTPAEWISLAIAALLLSGIVALVGYLWVNEQQQQPSILQVTRAQTRQAEGQFYVPFAVKNTGGETAEAVQVIAELQMNGTTIEAGEQIIDFLSSEETAEGAFVFTQNPQQGTLIIRVASYQAP